MPRDLEQWLPVVGYEGLYEVSDLGCIRSLHTRFVQPRPCKFGTDQTGYPTVMLSKEGKRKPFTVHRLVALAFHGEKRNALHCQVSHLDGDMKNPRADNLKWVSKTENESHKLRHGTRSSDRFSSLSEGMVRAIRGLAGCYSYQELSDILGVKRGTIQHIALRRSWRHIPAPYRNANVRPRRLSANQAAEIRRRVRDGERCADVGAEFGISRATAYRALSERER